MGLVVVGSKPGTAAGRVTLSAAAQYLIEMLRCPVLVLPHGWPFASNRPHSSRWWGGPPHHSPGTHYGRRMVQVQNRLTGAYRFLEGRERCSGEGR